MHLGTIECRFGVNRQTLQRAPRRKGFGLGIFGAMPEGFLR
jgi:hypothetical protein